MDRASKLLDIKNSNNLKKLLKTLGCGNGGSDAGQAINDVERTFEERKEFNEILKKYNDGKQDISPPRDEGPQNGPYYRKKHTREGRPVEVPVFNEEYQDNPAWRTTLREKEYGTIDEQQHARDLEDGYSKGKSNDFRKTGIEFDGSQNSEAREIWQTEFGTPKGGQKVVPQDFAMTKPKDQNSNNKNQSQKPTMSRSGFHVPEKAGPQDTELVSKYPREDQDTPLPPSINNSSKSPNNRRPTQANTSPANQRSSKVLSNQPGSPNVVRNRLGSKVSNSGSVKKRQTLEEQMKEIRQVKKDCERLVSEVRACDDLISQDVDIKGGLTQMNLWQTPEELAAEEAREKLNSDDPTY